MKILITNDDGWDAPGIQLLKTIAEDFGDIWLVAPEQPMSGIGHQLTFDRPMTLRQRAHQSFSLSGTPADCSRVGLNHFDVRFDWILSGINFGANLGADIPVSGTVAAVREAGFFGCRGIAISQYLNNFRSDFQWSFSEQLVRRLLPQLLETPIETGQWLNVNLPDVKNQRADQIPIAHTSVDTNPLPGTYTSTGEDQIIYQGDYQQRLRLPGSDVDACFGGRVSITQHP